MSEALKPCPFCEKTASVINCPEEWNEGAVVVACDSCGGSAPVVFGVKDDPNPHARALWNTRPIEDALRARIAELETAIVYLADLRSAYWDRPRNGHGRRLIETDCGAMRLLAEGATPLEAVEKALKARKRLEELKNGNDSKG